MAKIEGVRNPADLMTKYVATDVLQRLKTFIGVADNWFKDAAATDAHDTDDHVAALNAHRMSPPARPCARSLHCACVHSAHPVRECFLGRRWTEVRAEGL